jgi:hypothetical protein
MHDLCLITVEGNLKAHTKVAQRAPVAYYENALVSQAIPALMPNVVTSGHFSGRKVISVMKGIKPCTAEQQKIPEPPCFALCWWNSGYHAIRFYAGYSNNHAR